MNSSTLDILRCPYCGGRLSLVESIFHRRDGDDLQDAVLGCHCCIFALVDGIPVLHLQPAAVAARDHIQAGRPDRARQTMFGLEDEGAAEAFAAVAASPAATYRETVDALGPNFEGGYFLYRFSDPTFLVADAVVRAVARLATGGIGRTIDICGGSGHLTRSLLEVSSAPPILADLYFAKVWLARRFTAPGCEPVCCDGNAPMPFAKGVFSFAMCVDAFMYIWTKRQFVGEMTRLVDGARGLGTVLIGHTHNERTWTPSHGQPLSPEGYVDLFETFEPRVFGETRLFEDVVSGGPLDLSRRESSDSLDREQALTIVATRNPDVFARHPLQKRTAVRGELRVNPLYAQEPNGDRVRLRLRFPSEDYELEYGACRRYLPEQVDVARQDLELLPGTTLPASLEDLGNRRVILDLPKLYY
jgi:uncharacterized protein YbaR (Trm112 family)